MTHRICALAAFSACSWQQPEQCVSLLASIMEILTKRVCTQHFLRFIFFILRLPLSQRLRTHRTYLHLTLPHIISSPLSHRSAQINEPRIRLESNWSYNNTYLRVKLHQPCNANRFKRHKGCATMRLLEGRGDTAGGEMGGHIWSMFMWPRMSILAYILRSEGLSHAIELSCLGQLFWGGGVEGGNKDPLAVPHVRVNNTHTFYRTQHSLQTHMHVKPYLNAVFFSWHI